MDERAIRFRPRAVLVVLGLLVATIVVVRVVLATQEVLIWVAIAVLIAMALNPAVDGLQARGLRRGAAVAVVVGVTTLIVIGIGALFVPRLISEVNDFAQAVPGYVDDLTKGRGRLGFLERDYHIVEKVRQAIKKSGVSGALGLTTTAVAVTKSVIHAVVAVFTIMFLTLFMLLEGPAWVERIYSLLPEESQPRWRKVGHDIYRTISGYVTGNLALSFLAGVTSAVLLLGLGVPFALALGLLVAIFDLIPMVGATIAAVIVSTVGFIHSITAGIVLIVFFIVYQQFENQVLQPLVYGRTVQLSPLIVMIAVLMGAKLAGVVGALGAIPVAGAIQVVVVDWLAYRGKLSTETTEPPGPAPSPP